MAAAWSAASTGIEPGERDGHRERDGEESRQIYRGFIALRLATLRLADGARVSREIIEHGKAARWLFPMTPGAAPSCSCLPVSAFQ